MAMVNVYCLGRQLCIDCWRYKETVLITPIMVIAMTAVSEMERG